MAPQQRDMRVESVGSLCDSTYAGGAAAIRPAPEATFSDDDDGGTLRSSSAMAAPGGKRSTLAPLPEPPPRRSASPPARTMTPPLSIGAAFQIAEGDLDIGDVIGSGAFGTVKAARWRHTPVAVKVLYHDARADDRQLFEKEVQLMATLHHPNIVQFLGYAHTPALALVLEIFENGSIEAYVPAKAPGVKRSHGFCVDMARAVEYLHSRRPRLVIHRDIKPPNFLLTTSLVVKLGDFGIARTRQGPPKPQRDLDSSDEGAPPTPERPRAKSFGEKLLTRMRQGSAESDDATDLTANCGTVRFMAPEVASPGPSVPYTSSADVFSLALVFYFIYERKQPSLGATNPAGHLAALRGGNRPPFHRTPRVMRDLIGRMWALDEHDRPTAMEVSTHLDKMRCKPIALGSSWALVI